MQLAFPSTCSGSEGSAPLEGRQHGVDQLLLLGGWVIMAEQGEGRVGGRPVKDLTHQAATECVETW